jgi:hypothetical protein
MGRHSARDDDHLVAEVAEVADTAEVDNGSEPMPTIGQPGRHARAEDGVAVATFTDPATAAPEPPARRSGTRADLRLLREQTPLRARCAAAIVVPFVIYALALMIIGRTDVFLLWIWIPMVTAGVLFGGFLDAAHRRAA